MDTKARRRLPIGLQTFRELREEDCYYYYYVDKTGFIARLLKEGKHYFLSRPRRFGKSLFLDTLKELFEGNEALFTGLHIHNRWDWSLRHPIVRLDFGSGHFGEPGYVHVSAMAQLAAAAQDGGVATSYDTAPERFRDLLRVLHARTGRRVVVLVDEYDKPLLDALDTPDVARANRDYLLGLYSTIKSSDADVHFTLLTGVSKFSMAGVFSGLNNLTDITLDPRYSAICGYTEVDLDTVFAPELPGLERERIRHWYDGYNWRGAERVYNPFDILLLFDKRKFGCLLRGLLRERVLLVLRGDRLRRHGGGFEQPRAGGHGGALREQRLSVRVQCGGAGVRWRSAGAAQGAGLRGQVPRVRRAHPPDRGGVQQGDAQRDGVRRGAGLSWAPRVRQGCRHPPLRRRSGEWAAAGPDHAAEGWLGRAGQDGAVTYSRDDSLVNGLITTD